MIVSLSIRTHIILFICPGISRSFLSKWSNEKVLCTPIEKKRQLADEVELVCCICDPLNLPAQLIKPFQRLSREIKHRCVLSFLAKTSGSAFLQKMFSPPKSVVINAGVFFCVNNSPSNCYWVEAAVIPMYPMLFSLTSSLLRRRRVLLLLPLYPLVFLLCLHNLDILSSSSSKSPMVKRATTTIVTAYYKLRSKHSHEEVLVSWLKLLLMKNVMF